MKCTDKNFKPIGSKELKRIAKHVAKLCKNNVKVGKMLTFSKLYGKHEIISKKHGACVGTCGKHCTGCENLCYVKSMYRYNSVIDRHAENTLAMRDNEETAFLAIWSQLYRMRSVMDYTRWHASVFSKQ